ncbi:MAG: SDR family oxidoreductase [Deltaproteobacteria bacterium]|nr:SDR family oxidoreductase [Deltaproteobacteria bacterium]
MVTLRAARRQPRRRRVLVTGYPGFIGRRLVEKILASETDARLVLLTQEKFLARARALLGRLPPAQAARATVLEGDIVAMDLGLTGDEYRALTATVTDIYHLAAIFYLGVPAGEAKRVNVDGTRQVLELARGCRRLRRLNHFSTCYVSGDRTGVIEEDELDCGQRFRNHYERTKFQAEQLVAAAASELPITVFRPSIVVGDSHTGEIDRFDGVYHIGILVMASPVAVPLPGEAVAPLNLVPVDFVVNACHRISIDPRAIGRTFHIVDPNPLSSRRIHELFATRSGKRMPRWHLNYRVTKLLLSVPGLEKMARQPAQALEYLNHLAIYNCPNTLELLDGTGIMCPRFESYADNLMRYVRRHLRAREAARARAADDPLDR